MNVEIRCTGCGKLIERRLDQIKRHNFCSRECFRKWRVRSVLNSRSPSPL